jgi:hypothetical protein
VATYIVTQGLVVIGDNNIRYLDIIYLGLVNSELASSIFRFYNNSTTII